MRNPEIPGVPQSATKVARRTRNLERRGIPGPGGGVPPFVDMGAPDVIVVGGDDPVVNPSQWFMSFRPGENLATGDVILGLMSVTIDTDPGTTGLGIPNRSGGYEISCDPYVGWPGYAFVAGSGWTEPGGIPYPVSVSVSPTTGRFILLCASELDPDVATYGNVVRPDWPAAYGANDLIFYGEFMLSVAAP